MYFNGWNRAPDRNGKCGGCLSRQEQRGVGWKYYEEKHQNLRKSTVTGTYAPGAESCGLLIVLCGNLYRISYYIHRCTHFTKFRDNSVHHVQDLRELPY